VCSSDLQSLFIVRTIRNTQIHRVWAECRVCTSQETHYVSTAKPSRLMLFGETVAVSCENHTEHSDTLCGYTNLFHTSQETHYVSATKPNRLMLFRETVAVYCENHTEYTNTLCGQNAEFWCVKAGGMYTDL
jgi:hypothetical protein